jgi:protein involved in polysaccharide export with SLBB domain
MVEMKASMYTSVQPDDTVFVPEAKSVEVVGEVKRPGSIRYESGMSLLKAIDLAGGATLKGSVENAVIKRVSNGRVAEMKASMYTSVQPDDTIFVPELRSFHVTGEVKQPGSFPYEPRLTLLRAIAMAGGATKKAAPDDSIIKRVKNGKIEEIEATMDTLILPDDVIEVPLSFW